MSKKNTLFAQLTGFLTIANSHRLPDKTKQAILKAPEGTIKAIQVSVLEVGEFQAQLAAALEGVEISDEVKTALDLAVVEATQKLTGKLRVSKSKGNLTSNVAVAFKHITPVLVEGSKEMEEGEMDEEMVAALLS
jgi:hypothetical protein